MLSQMAVSEEVVMIAVRDLKNGKIQDAIARFAGKFRLKGYGLGFEFTDIEQPGEFLQKTRELYPDSVLRTETIFLSGDHVARDLRRAHGERHDHTLGGLLPRANR